MSGFSERRRDAKKNYVCVICDPSSYLSVGGTGGAVCQPLVIVSRGQCCDRESVKRDKPIPVRIQTIVLNALRSLIANICAFDHAKSVYTNIFRGLFRPSDL